MPTNLHQLISALADSDPAARAKAAEELSHLGADASPAATALVHAAADEVEEVREHAVAALEELGPPPLSQLGEMTGLLSHDSADVNYWAATLLGRLGPDAAPSAETLARVVVGTASAAVRQRAAWALGEIGPGVAAAIPALKTAAGDPDPRLARLAAEAIQKIGGQ